MSGMWLGEAPRMDTKKTKSLKANGVWIMCSKFDNHSNLICQHNWEDLYDH